jgi:hypothetical protein
MASGHANRANRPNTWLHRPATRREVFTCQPGAVHTWHICNMLSLRKLVLNTLQNRTCEARVKRRSSKLNFISPPVVVTAPTKGIRDHRD